MTLSGARRQAASRAPALIEWWPRSAWARSVRSRRGKSRVSPATAVLAATDHIPRYSCWRGSLDNGEPRCIAFGGLRVDDAIEEALLRVVEPGAIAAAVEAEAQAASRRDQVRDALVRD